MTVDAGPVPVGTSNGSRMPLRPATLDRIAEALTFDSGEAVAVLHGPGWNDEFCGADLQLRVIDAVLLHHLKAAGYRRVMFCTLDGLYYLDAESAAAGGARGGRADDGRARSERRLRYFKGPRGSRDVVERPEAEGPRPGRAMTDPSKVQQLHALMTGPGPRTAVVVLRAEAFLHHNVAARELTDRIGEWLQNGRSARNLAVLVFSNDSIDDVIATLERSHAQSTLLAFLRGGQGHRRSGSIGRIGRADKRELTRLVHRARLREGLTLADWTELPRIAAGMAARGTSVKDWDARLVGIGTSEPLSAKLLRDRGWIDASTADGRSARERLDQLTGLQAVKEHIHLLVAQAESERSRPRLSEREAEPPSLHLVFSGNPGTGKTTVARLLGEIYRDIGLLRYGTLHAVKVSDLVAGYEGQTAIRTNEAVDAALGGVLFIDEAYQLSARNDGFGQEAINALNPRLEDDRDKFMTIAAGYRRQMEDFLASNPGLASRFETTLHFPDYEPDELLAIALDMLESRHLRGDDEFVAALRGAVEFIHRRRDPENFGNAREMRTLTREIDQNWSLRVGAPYTQPLSELDIPERYRAEQPAAGCWERLDQLTGLRSVTDHLRRLARQVESRRLRAAREGHVPEPASPHLIFSGNPGTGKTTVARLMAEAYADIGVLRSDKLHAVEASDLVAGYVGQTAIRTNEAVDAALGGVLFIDEAYRLSETDRGGFGQEAIDTLVTRLENDRGDFVVIAAGYPKNMERFLGSNPGLRSRFPARNVVHFPDYSPGELVTIVTRMLQDHSLTWGDGFASALRRAVERLHRERDRATFGNAREMRELAEEIDQNWSNRIEAPYTDPLSIADIPARYREDDS